MIFCQIMNFMDRWQSWSIAPDLKSGGPKGSVGSNPTLSGFCMESWLSGLRQSFAKAPGC
jgi:hypothetical protein